MEFARHDTSHRAVRSKNIGYLKASKYYNVPRSTLFRFVAEKDIASAKLVEKKIGRKTVFDEKYEETS